MAKNLKTYPGLRIETFSCTGFIIPRPNIDNNA